MLCLLGLTVAHLASVALQDIQTLLLGTPCLPLQRSCMFSRHLPLYDPTLNIWSLLRVGTPSSQFCRYEGKFCPTVSPFLSHRSCLYLCVLFSFQQQVLPGP